MKIKVLIINTIPFNHNGMAVTIMNYFNNFDQTVVHCDFIVNKFVDSTFENEMVRRGSRVFLFKNRNRNPLGYVRWLANIVDSNNYDIVYIHGNSATMAAELYASRKSKAIKIVHSHGVETDHPVIHRLLNPYFLRHYDYAFAASEKSGQWLFPNRKYTVINNGIDVNKFALSEHARKRVRQQLEIKDDEQVIIQVGSFTRQKNHQFLLKTFNKYIKSGHKAHLLLLGSGPLKANLVAYCTDENILKLVHFLGEQSDTRAYYSAADLFVLPSIFEPFGIVTLEAQANGLNCIVSDVVPKVVNLTDNVTFLPLNEDVWVGKMTEFEQNKHHNYSSSEMKKLYGEKHFDIVQDAKNMQDIFLKLQRNKS